MIINQFARSKLIPY